MWLVLHLPNLFYQHLTVNDQPHQWSVWIAGKANPGPLEWVKERWTLDCKPLWIFKLEFEICVSLVGRDFNPVPCLSFVIVKNKHARIYTVGPPLNHESSADCERGRKVFFPKWGVSVTLVLVSFPIIVQRKVESHQRGAEGNWAIFSLNIRISGVAPHLGITIRIPTEVVISDMGELVIVWLCVWPSLTRDSVNSRIRFSPIGTTWS